MLNLIRKLRIRRLKWMGHILRAGPGILMFCVIRAQIEMGQQGNLLMDTPPTHINRGTSSPCDGQSFVARTCGWNSLVFTLFLNTHHPEYGISDTSIYTKKKQSKLNERQPQHEMKEDRNPRVSSSFIIYDLFMIK